MLAHCREQPPSAWDSDTICSTVKDLKVATANLESNAKAMEEFYRGVYLGMHKATPLADPTTRNAWEKPSLEFIVHLDTNPPVERTEVHSLFEQSMRFTANTRELLWKALNLPIAALK